MWQVPNQKLRAMMNARRRERERRQNSFHVSRTQAKMKIVSNPDPATVADVRVILNDITPQGMNLFSSEPMIVGQVVAITLEQPKLAYVQARIICCQDLAFDKHVISEHPFPFRLTVAFIFESDAEAKAFREYCEVLGREVLGTVKTAA